MLRQIGQPYNRIRELLSRPTAGSPGSHRQRRAVPDDLRVLDNGVAYTDDGVLDHVWFHLEENGRRYFKVVCLNVLTYLPREMRETMTVLEKTRKVLKGIYTAQVDFLYLVANVTDPPLGVVQIYGVQALAGERDDAVTGARRGLGAVRAAMANFEQSRLEPVKLKLAEWIRRGFGMPLALTVIGHPDPRTDGSRGMTTAGGGQETATQADIDLQQNEYLFRGMAAERHEFLNVVLVSRMGNGDQADLYRLQERVAQELSIWASKEKFTRATSVGIGLPMMLTGNIGDGASSGYGSSHSAGVGETTGRSVSKAHTEGHAEGRAWGQSHTESENWGTSTSSGSSWGTTTSASETTSTNTGTSHTDTASAGTADGSMHSQSATHGSADTAGSADTSSSSHTSGSGSASGSSWGAATTASHGASHSQGQAVSGNLGFMGTGVGATGSESATESFGVSQTSSVGGFSSSSSMSSSTSGQAHTNSQSHTDSHSASVSDGASHTVSQSASAADGVSQGASHSITTGASTMRGGFSSSTSSHGHGVADTEFSSQSVSDSVADSTSVGASTSRSRGESVGISRAQSLTSFRGLGMAAGVSPSISMSKIFQGEDHVATMVADVLRGQEAQLRTMALEGGVYVDNYFLCATPEARAALEALIPMAFHGTEEVTTPVRPRRLSPAVEKYIRLRAFSFTPSNRPSRLPWVLEPWADTTLLTLLQAATYVAPGAFEQGLATTVQERIPPFAFYTRMAGEVVLGHQYSYEIGGREPTEVPVRLARDRMSNWAFCADTRMGKSVLAERLVFEVVTEWQYRVIVADFGAGWRKLTTALPRDQVDLWGLSPSSPRPIRWNPLQIGRRIAPGIQMTATAELLCNAGRMGERQLGHIINTLEMLYVRHGVLVHDPAVWQSKEWGWVQGEEARELSLPSGASLADMDDEELQSLAVYRSREVDLSMLYESLQKLQKTFRPGSPDHTSVEGVLLRLRHLVTGRVGQMYGRGAGSLAIEDLGLPHGVCVLEGGAQLSEYAKAALLSLMSWRLYTDAVARREEGLAGVEHAPLFLLFEEGNKIITGVDSGVSDGPRIQSDIIPSMFRDAGKYHIFLGTIVQSPAELPPGIMSSCNNLAAGQLKNGDDVQVVMSGFARSPVGFVDTQYARFVNRMQRGQFVLKLGLAWDVAATEPLLFKPLMVEAHEPSRSEIRTLFRWRRQE